MKYIVCISLSDEIFGSGNALIQGCEISCFDGGFLSTEGKSLILVNNLAGKKEFCMPKATESPLDFEAMIQLLQALYCTTVCLVTKSQ